METLHLRLEPSPSLVAAFTAAHLGAAAGALASGLPAWLSWPLAAVVVLRAVSCIALHATLRSPRAVVHLTWTGDGRWRLVERDGRVIDAALEHGSYSHPALVALVLRDAEGRRRRVLMVADRIGAEDLRRLRVRLRCRDSEPTGEDHGATLC